MAKQRRPAIIEKTGWIRRRLSAGNLAFGLILLAGCQSETERLLVGRWDMSNVGHVVQRLGDEFNTDKSADGEDPRMTVQFAWRGQLQTITMLGKIQSTKTGKWRIVRYDPAKNILQIECDLQGQTTTHDIEFETDDTIRWIPPNLAGTNRKLKFQRR
jgi:hypothetical protein